MSESTGSEAVMPTINAHLAAELIVEGETWPVFVWTIDHPAGRVLVDTGMIDVRPEVDDARSLDDYTIREWVDFDGATYVEHEGEVELLPGIRLMPARGHTDGHQVVVVETGAGTNVLGGDVGVWFGELGSGTTEGQRRVLALGAPTWLSHAPGPKIPEHRP